MALPIQTIRKFFREGFPGTSPLVVDPAKRAKIADELKQRLERIEGVEPRDHVSMRDGEKERHVAAFTISDPHAYYYYGSTQSFRLDLDEASRLTIRETHDHRKDAPVALVGDLDEIVRFVRQCKQRIDRKKALKSQRGKVRGFTAQAILAQVRKLARQDKFDFLTDPDDQKLNLYIKLSDEQVVVFPLPFKGFETLLPKLRPAIVALRKLHDAGIRFRHVTMHKVPHRKTWITHRSLEESADSEVDNDE